MQEKFKILWFDELFCIHWKIMKFFYYSNCKNKYGTFSLNEYVITI